MASSYPRLPLLPRASGSQPGAVSPQAWNAMVAYCEELSRRVAALTPQSSPDIAVKNTPSGFTSHLKRRSAAGRGVTSNLLPWQPTFSQSGTDPSITYTCRFNLGTINNVPASNWNDEFTLSMGAGAYFFVVATITTSSGQVTGVTLSVEATAPATDDIAKGTPPTSHKIVLGAIGRTDAKMIETTNLNATAALVFLESKAAPAEGAEPYDRWWRWSHTSV